MRNRPVKDPEKALARAVDAGPLPGRAETLEDRLLDAGVPCDALGDVVEMIADERVRGTAEAIRRLLLLMDGLTAADALRSQVVALQRAILGADGRSLADDAAVAGIAAPNLLKSENRIRERLSKNVG